MYKSSATIDDVFHLALPGETQLLVGTEYLTCFFRQLGMQPAAKPAGLSQTRRQRARSSTWRTSAGWIPRCGSTGWCAACRLPASPPPWR